jgi:hypothetical protein
VEAIRRAFAAAERASHGRPPVRAVLVLQRDPLFVVGGGSYLDEMLRVFRELYAGAELQPAERDAAFHDD